MSAGHHRDLDDSRHPEPPLTVRRTVTAIIVPLMAATLIGLIVLWPRGPSPTETTDEAVRARGQVISATPACPAQTPATPEGDCGTATVRLGSDTVIATVPTGATAPEISVGDRVVVIVTADPDDPETVEYTLVDHDRRSPMAVLVALFAAAVIAFARWRGVASLIGLAISFAVLLLFILPAIQRGQPPLAVAVVGASAIMFAVIYLTHGISVATSMAVLGTLAALLLTGVLGTLVTASFRLTGAGTEEAAILTNVLAGVDLRGLLLAGIIIGTLGVLDDVTITQSAIVGELARADPSLPTRRLYSAAIRVGRAHVGAVVNTIILAYAGASLPLMLLLVTAGTATTDVLTTQLIATEIVRGAVGTLGLIAAVPITTALASLLTVRGRSG